MAEGLSPTVRFEMCDYSLHSIKSRPAKVGDKLITRDFGTGTRGFAASEDRSVAVCVLPGTELSFSQDVTCLATGLLPWRGRVVGHNTAIFRQINKDKVAAHHDALEFPDGRIALLTTLCEGQEATVLQLPAEPKTAVEAQKQRRVAYIGYPSRQTTTRWPPIARCHFGTPVAANQTRGTRSVEAMMPKLIRLTVVGLL